MKIFLSILIACSLLASCATTNVKPMYYWNPTVKVKNKNDKTALVSTSYVNTLWALKKTPTDDSKKAYANQLLYIIEASNNNNANVPPGVYAEYGYILLLGGQKDESLKYFKLEQQLYPLSNAYIQKIITKIENNK